MLEPWEVDLSLPRVRRPMLGWRRTIGRLVLAACGVGLVLLVAEGAARIALLSLEGEHRRASASARLLDPALPKLSRNDLVRANVEGIFKGAYYRTNEAALRGPDYLQSPHPHSYRIAIGGDSVTVGSGVSEEDAYPMVLEGLFDRDHGERRVEVINAGLGGINAEWVVSRLERASQSYRFHLAVYGWTVNDIFGPAYRQSPEDRAWIDEPRRFEGSSSHLLRLLWPRVIWVVERFSSGSGIEREFRRNYFENPQAWGDFVHQLERLARFTNERGICGHVFLHTRLSKLDGRHTLNDVYERVAEAARAAGLSVTESFGHHEGRGDSDLWVRIYDPHPNIEGHRILAEALHEGLQRDLPEECWRVNLTQWPKLAPQSKETRARVRRASGD